MYALAYEQTSVTRVFWLWSAPTLVSSSFLDLSGYFYTLWCWNMEERLGGKGHILSWEFLLLVLISA